MFGFSIKGHQPSKFLTPQDVSEVDTLHSHSVFTFAVVEVSRNDFSLYQSLGHSFLTFNGRKMRNFNVRWTTPRWQLVLLLSLAGMSPAVGSTWHGNPGIGNHRPPNFENIIGTDTEIPMGSQETMMPLSPPQTYWEGDVEITFLVLSKSGESESIF